MRTITESVEVACGPEQLFRTLHTPTEICIWWNTRTAIVVPQRDGLWIGTWGKDEDHPDYITAARLSQFDPPHRMVMSDVEYWANGERTVPFARQLVTEYRVEPTSGGSRLTVTQTGFPDEAIADEFYQGCCHGWKETLAAIKDFF
jgi:uncharacterized protein YndB with AHSA1/START domain